MRLRLRVTPTGATRPRERNERPEEDRSTVLVREAIDEQETPLPDELLEEMEARFGRSLDGVAVHAGPRADAAAQELDARAFALGRHLVFAEGALELDTLEGRRLLAHELAHALQCGLAEAPADEGWLTSAPHSGENVSHVGLPPVSDVAEATAREAAALVTSDRAVAPGALAESAGDPVIQRWPMALPVRESAAPLANPLVETLALDVAKALESDPADTNGRVRRRLGRLGDAVRAAVVGRVQELLTPAQRERAAAALSGAAIGEPETAPAAAEPAAEATEERVTELRREDEEATERRHEAERRETVVREREAERQAAQQPPREAEPPPAEAPAAEEQAAGAAQEQSDAETAATAAPEAAAEKPAPAEGEAQPDTEAEATAALPGQAAGEGAAGAASAPGETQGTTGAVAADLAPVADAESEVDTDLTAREQAATLRAEQAEQVVVAIESEEAAASADGPAAAGAGVAAAGVGGAGDVETGIGGVAGDVGGVGAGGGAAADVGAAAGGATVDADTTDVGGGAVGLASGPAGGAAEPAGGGVPADAEPGSVANVPPEPEPPEPAAAEPEPTSEEVAVAASPTPPTTPEVEAATAEATAQIEAGEDAEGADADVGTAPAEPDVEAAGSVAGAGAGGPAGVAGPAPGGGAAAGDAVADIGDVEADVAGGGEIAGGRPEAGEAEGGEVEGGGAEGEAAPEGGATDAIAGEGDGAAAGGDCGPDAPGGGGGGGAIADPPLEEVPDVSGAPPAEAMSSIASLGPAEMGKAVAGVTTAATSEVSQEHATLEATPPTLERPAGSPQTRPKKAADRAAGAAPDSATPADVAAAPPSAPAPRPTVEPLPPLPPPPTKGIAVPHAAAGAQGTASAADAQALRDSIDSLPTTDPGLEVTAGPAPTVELEGEADPERAAEQRRLLDDANAKALAGGKVDAAAPLGEADVYPDVPPETLSAEVPAGGEAAAGAPIVVDDEATAIIAKEEFSADVQTAAQSASGELTTARTDHDTKVADEHTKAKADADKAESENAAKQEAARKEVQTGVGRERKSWRAEQDTAVETAETGADAEQKAGSETVETEQGKADKKAAEHIDAGNEKADGHRKDAEGKAKTKKQEAKKESGGVLDWIGSKVSSFFSAIKEAIGDIFAAARKLVRAAIGAAQKLAMEVIDAARKAIVAAIKAVGAALIAIGDVLLAAFPELRDKFRKAITAIVDTAVDAVNALADALKAAVQAILNLLAAAIDAYLKLLEAIYLAAIKIVEDAIKGALDAAAALVKLIGQFAALAKHIAPDPLGWLRNLGSSAVDGIRNHLWTAMKCAVKEWFNSKVQAVLGLGKAIIALLKKGGINFTKIAKIAFDAIKAALPTMVVTLLIEKLISLLVPAASALMLIIDGLRAAYGAMSRIIAAIDAFMAFLLAVKGGNAGKQFATALAAGVIAVIDFISNFLLVRMKGAAAGASGRLAGMASKIGTSLGKVGKAAARTAKAVAKVGKKVVGGAKAVGKVVKKAGKAVVGVVKKVGKKIVGGLRKAGKAIGKRLTRFPKVRAALGRARALWRNAKARIKKWQRDRKRRAAERKRRKKQAAEDRLKRAVAAIKPPLGAMVENGVNSLYLRARLFAWQVRWRLRYLGVRANGVIEARVNPRYEFYSIEHIRIGQALDRILHLAEKRFLEAEEKKKDTKAVIDEAISRVEAGRTDLPSMTRAQQVIFFRRLRELPKWKKGAGRDLTFGSDPTTTTPFAHKALSRYFVDASPKLGGGSYTALVVALKAAAAAFRVSQAALLAAVRAPGPRAMAARIREITKGWSPARKASFAATVVPLLRQLAVLTQALEAARSPGILSSGSVANAMGATADETLSRGGKLGPMTPLKSGAAADRRRAKKMYGRPVASARGPKFPKKPGAVLSGAWAIAEHRRVGRQLNIFQRLRRQLEQGKLDAKKGAEGRALRKLAEAFDTWMKRQTGDLPSDPVALQKSADRLVERVVIFLKTYHGKS